APSPAAVASVRRTHPSGTSGAASDTPARLDVEHEPLGVEADAGNDGVLQLQQVSEYTGDAHGTSEVAVGLGTSEATVCSVRIFLRSQRRPLRPLRPSPRGAMPDSRCRRAH